MVDNQGHVKDVQVLRSIPELDEAAIDAVAKWEFEPASVGGAPTPMVTTMTVSFTIDE
jgi:TonB family protein